VCLCGFWAPSCTCIDTAFCVLEDRAIVRGLRNALPQRLRDSLAVRIAVRTQIHLLTYLVSEQQTACERAEEEARARQSQDGMPMTGVYIPQCDDEGNYQPLQSHASTGYRWCVDKRGREITGTSTPPEKPDPICPPHRGNYC